MNLLILEDDSNFVNTLQSLIGSKYKTVIATTVEMAYTAVENETFELIIADRLLGSVDSLEFIEYVHDVQPNAKVLCVSAMGSSNERVKSLRVGADDYLVKPICAQEFLLKMTKMISYIKSKPDSNVSMCGLEFDKNAGTLTTTDEIIYLRKKESLILECLYRYRNHVVSREKIIAEVWYGDEIPYDSTLDVYIRRLRIKLKKHPNMIKTVRGFGYALMTSVRT